MVLLRTAPHITFLNHYNHTPPMSLESNVALRKKKREEKEQRIHEIDDILNKPQRSYLPSTRTLTLILVVLVILSLVYGYFNMEVIVKEDCALMPGIDCNNVVITGATISLDVSNHMKEDLNIILELEGCEGEQSHTVKPNTKEIYTFECATDGGTVRKKIYMTHVSYTGLPHTTQGFIVGTRK